MVTAIIIVEMMGKPAEHLKKALEEHANNLKSKKNVEVKSLKVNDPKDIENSNGMFSCFAEIEFEVKTLKELFDVIFDYMPSSVEIAEPKNVSMGLEEATALMNNLAGRLHRYDEVARTAKFRLDHMMQQLKIATKVMEDNGLAKDGKLVPAVAKKLMAGDSTGAKKKVAKGKKKATQGRVPTRGKKKKSRK
jgi:hypothetical protein